MYCFRGTSKDSSKKDTRVQTSIRHKEIDTANKIVKDYVRKTKKGM